MDGEEPEGTKFKKQSDQLLQSPSIRLDILRSDNSISVGYSDNNCGLKPVCDKDRVGGMVCGMRVRAQASGEKRGFQGLPASTGSRTLSSKGHRDTVGREVA